MGRNKKNESANQLANLGFLPSEVLCSMQNLPDQPENHILHNLGHGCAPYSWCQPLKNLQICEYDEDDEDDEDEDEDEDDEDDEDDDDDDDSYTLLLIYIYIYYHYILLYTIMLYIYTHIDILITSIIKMMIMIIVLEGFNLNPQNPQDVHGLAEHPLCLSQSRRSRFPTPKT